jgi:hypothetical protein
MMGPDCHHREERPARMNDADHHPLPEGYDKQLNRPQRESLARIAAKFWKS